jgi:hypothetical protein
MRTLAALALGLVLGAGIAMPAIAVDPAAVASDPAVATKYVVHVDGMT